MLDSKTEHECVVEIESKEVTAAARGGGIGGRATQQVDGGGSTVSIR